MQYIFQEAVTPNGAVANVHRIHKIEITDEVLVVVNSYTSTESNMLVWQDTHIMPKLVFESGLYPNNVYEWLTSPDGPFPSGTLIEDFSELEIQQLRLLSQITTMREQTISSGCVTEFGRVDTDDLSIRNIMGTYQAASMAKMASQPFSETWRMTDNSVVELNADGMISIGNAVMAHIKACYQHSWILKEQVMNATSETIGQVVISVGWPEN